MYLKAVEAVQREIALLRDGTQEELAEEIGQLGMVHVAMGNLRQAERDEVQALRIREALGDPLGVALTEDDLADAYDEGREFKRAADYAEKAFAILSNRPDVSATDRVLVRLRLGFALTGMRSCEQGIGILKDALELARNSLGADDLMVGDTEYELGFGYWHCGDRDHAAEWLERGTSHMKAAFGWDRTTYLNAMSHYARFLRENGQLEAADSAEAIVHQAEAVVDARSLTGRSKGLPTPGAK